MNSRAFVQHCARARAIFTAAICPRKTFLWGREPAAATTTASYTSPLFSAWWHGTSSPGKRTWLAYAAEDGLPGRDLRTNLPYHKHAYFSVYYTANQSYAWMTVRGRHSCLTLAAYTGHRTRRYAALHTPPLWTGHVFVTSCSPSYLYRRHLKSHFCVTACLCLPRMPACLPATSACLTLYEPSSRTGHLAVSAWDMAAQPHLSHCSACSHAALGMRPSLLVCIV